MIRRIFPVIMIMTLVLLSLLYSCTKEADTTVVNEPVVEGYLVAGQPISIKVYEQKGLTDTATYGPLITGLALQLSDGSKTVQLKETAKGTYTYTDNAFLISGKTYSLQFTYQGKVVSASTQMPGKPVNFKASRTDINLPSIYAWLSREPNSTDSIAVTFSWNNPDSLYHVLALKNESTSPPSSHGNYDLPVNVGINAKQSASYSMYYLSFNYLGTYQAILYTVDKVYDDALTSNSNTTSQKLTNPPTNIVNGFGTFAAMQADTITLHVTQN